MIEAIWDPQPTLKRHISCFFDSGYCWCPWSREANGKRSPRKAACGKDRNLQRDSSQEEWGTEKLVLQPKKIKGLTRHSVYIIRHWNALRDLNPLGLDISGHFLFFPLFMRFFGLLCLVRESDTKKEKVQNRKEKWKSFTTWTPLPNSKSVLIRMATEIITLYMCWCPVFLGEWGRSVL